MSKLKFKTESKKLLDLMINSIYTNKEIFIRELISNASDAIDKYHFNSLTDKLKSREYEIFVSIEQEKRTITIKDNGIGMTLEELKNNLGTIARSGSKEFIEKLGNKADLDVIGQFGVGFYASFMVSDKVEVITKSPYSKTAYKWSSLGQDEYEVKELDADLEGTEITLYLREDNEDYKYSTFLNESKIKQLITNYSDYIKYPIKMELTKTVDEKEVKEVEIINSMKPIWKKNKSEITEEEKNNFYKNQFSDYEDPLITIHTRVEGLLTYDAMIFIPKRAPFNLNSKNFEKGLQLFSKGVFIKENCSELVPEWMLFSRGLIDSSDLSLNISREMVQQSNQLTNIANAVEKKVKNVLKKTLEKDFDKYLEFWKLYGLNLKYGIYESMGAKCEFLQDLIIYETSHNSYTTIADYVKRMKENQKVIYYAVGKNKEQISSLPQMDMLKELDYEVIYMTDDIDEFVVTTINDYNGVSFQSITKGDLDLATEEKKKEVEEKAVEFKDLLEVIKSSLGDKVVKVILSTRLKDSPVCLVADEGISFEMEKVYSQIPGQSGIKAGRILEINPEHKLFDALQKLHQKYPLSVNKYADLLYTQALLIEGLPVENPIEFSNKMCELIIETAK